MAEGHAVARWADSLREVQGERVVAVTVPPRWRERAERVKGARLDGVRTHGKHLVLDFSSGWVIHTHAMQYGSWQVGPRDLTPRKDLRFARLQLATRKHLVLFYHGPVMEVLSKEEFAAHERFHTLGPDLLHDGFEPVAVHAAVRGQGDRPIGDTVLDQRIVAGIGNIYKSEGLFLAAVDPRRTSRSIGRSEMRVFFEELIPLMQLGRRVYGMTITLPDELRFEPWMRNWVYRRRAQPCFVCGTAIEMIRQGDFQRATYYCPHCQS